MNSNLREGFRRLRERRQGGKAAPAGQDIGEILDDLLFTSIRKTKKDYTKAVIDYVRNYHKDVIDRITETSSQVSKVYKACKEEQATLKDFKNVLEPYYNVRLKAIELYKTEAKNPQKL